MILNIIKNPELFENLKICNTIISNITNNYQFNSEYNLENNIISPWFDPNNIRNLGLSRTYPHMDPCQYRREYSLYLHCSNYLPLFLINSLYTPKDRPKIEDIGGGMGWLFVYLKNCGYSRFHIVDNFSQISEHTVRDFLSRADLECEINNNQFQPTVVNNVGVPGIFMREFSSTMEIVTFYTNRDLEERAKVELVDLGFTFLCRDTDNLSIAYCRKDKYKEFKSRLGRYEDTSI